MENLKEKFGNIDIYLLDQLLKGRIENEHKILDAGCGAGRNLYYFLKEGMEVYGVDQDPDAIAKLQELAHSIQPDYPLENFIVSDLVEMEFEEDSFDWVICNAVLHFAKSKEHFEAMLHKMWSCLKPGGYFIARLASSIGIEAKVQALGNGRYLLPDGSTRFLVSQQMIIDYTRELNGQFCEFIKTTNVQNLRCMTTWCLQK